MYPETDKIKDLFEPARHVVVIQADNPDGDSLGSALALEQILSELGKQVSLYCGVDIPTYLRYLQGWDRVSKDLPAQFDASVIVDASTTTLLEKLASSRQQNWVASKPCLVLDHHESVEKVIPYASILLNDTAASSTGELIYKLAKQLSWPIDTTSGSFIMTAILGDTQGLTNDLAKSETYRHMAELIELGINRPKIEEARREYSKMQPEIYKYKAELIDRTEFTAAGRLALVSIPQAEINQYSPLYNPAPLIQNDMLQTANVAVAIVLKNYDDGKITGAIRCNPGFPVAATLAEHFGGGGHANASGFKITDGRPFN